MMMFAALQVFTLFLLALKPLHNCIIKHYSTITHLAHSAKLPTGLYILLALISFLYLYFFNDFSETNYLRIHWTDLRNLFTE